MQMAWLSARRGDFADLHGRFQHLSLSAHVPICHFNRAGKKLPLNSLAQVLGVKPSHDRPTGSHPRGRLWLSGVVSGL